MSITIFFNEIKLENYSLKVNYRDLKKILYICSAILFDAIILIFFAEKEWNYCINSTDMKLEWKAVIAEVTKLLWHKSVYIYGE